MCKKILGISDEVTTCEACGKTNLKRTVVLQLAEGTVHYGSDCAAKAFYGTKKASDKKAIDTLADACSLARKWIEKGYDLETVAKGIWNKFGFLTSVKGDSLKIGDNGIV